ncbi:Rossman fold protein, TIGR00730 family [candidate division KSB1 bacterium 4484_87]|nr:MAG: Rossman fold protein, TIGR00730 family [candidate division KSB1 bacterium 4484_87]
MKKVCVYCASSRQIDPAFLDSARELGKIFAQNDIAIVYGGGSVGSMGALAEGALSEGGTVIGIIPDFMMKLEWGNNNITELIVVNDMQERRKKLIEGTEAVVALPGATGTMEELFEALTWKRLGFYLNPIILVNTRNFFDPLVKFFENCIAEKFMDERHRALWSVVSEPSEVISAIDSAPPWHEDAVHFASI